jgi:hypothetical protein
MTGDGAEARFDAEQIEVLRKWASGLADDGREEVRAAGRAISLLIEEVERLHVDLWHARTLATDVPEAPVETVPETLLGRIRLLLRRSNSPPIESET